MTTTKRRWFRFRLRSLFILVTLCCLAMGWYAVRVLPQKRAVAAIEAEFGSCGYDFRGPWPFDRNGVFHWLPDLLSEDVFYSLTWVTLQRPSDGTLAHLGNLTNLQMLVIEHGITDEGLRHLSRVRKLRALHIHGSEITGEGFAALVDLAHFKQLTVQRCNELTAAGQHHIGQLQYLEELTVDGCDSVTADCLRPIIARGNLVTLYVRDCPQVDFTQLDLTPLRQLERLEVSNVQMTGAELEQIGQLDQLKELTIASCPNIQGNAYAVLGGCHQLTELNLDSLMINDIGLECLAGMDELNGLWLENCANVTGLGLKHLLPGPMLDRIVLRDLVQLRELPLDRLSELPKLSMLEFLNCPVTDADIAKLCGESSRLKNLSWIDLDDTLVTHHGIAQLLAAYPTSTIDVNGIDAAPPGTAPASVDLDAGEQP